MPLQTKMRPTTMAAALIREICLQGPKIEALHARGLKDLERDSYGGDLCCGDGCCAAGQILHRGQLPAEMKRGCPIT